MSSYAVVMNPPAKKTRAVKKYHAKLRRVGEVYKQMRRGNKPSWQEFVSATLKGAKFNPPGGMQIGVAGMSFSLTYLVSDVAEHRVRKASFAKYLVEDKTNTTKSRMFKYYGSQIASTILVGSTTTLGSWMIAKRFNQGKAAIFGGLAAMAIKVAYRSLDAYKCKDYDQIDHVIQKEAKKWASADKEYFGEEYKEAIDFALLQDYYNTNNNQPSNVIDVTNQQGNQIDDSSTVAGYIDDPYAVNYMR